MECDDASILMMKYMDMSLTDKEDAALNEHLDVCAICKEDYMIYKQLTVQFEEESLLDPPFDFEDRVMRKIALITPEYKALALTADLATGVSIGIISIVIGLSIIMSTFSAEIMSFVAGYPFVHRAFTYFGLVWNDFVSLFNVFGNGTAAFLNNLGAMIESVQFVALAVVVLLIGVQYGLRLKTRNNMSETAL